MGLAIAFGRFGYRGRELAVAGTIRNLLLAALPRDNLARLAADLEPVWYEAGTAICEEGDRLSHAYFPEDSVVSLIGATRDGATVETGMVGSEGAIGIASFLGGGLMHGRAVVQRGGRMLKLPAPALRGMFRRCEDFQSGLLRFTEAFVVQLTERALCQRICTIEERLCCWLLLMHDRLDGDELAITHETLAGLLGARRQGVTSAAKRLLDEGLLRYVRGNVTIVDRDTIEERSCECYAVIRRAYQRLVGCRRVAGKAVPGAAQDAWLPARHAGA